VTAHTPELSAPEPLGPDHDLEDFCSDTVALDDWLKRHARHNEAEGGSRTFVLCGGNKVVGYYSLAAGSLISGSATGRVRRNMPNPIPIVLLGRLAIDRAWQGRGLGGDLLRDAMLRAMAAGKILGVRAILVHAISPEAKAFYEKHGLKPSPVDPMTLMITMAEAERMLDAGH
jgi:GNAT superfamily N-acetyltransferase